MSIDYAAIVAVAQGHLKRAEPEEMAFRAEVLDLEETALWQAAIYEVAHTLGVGMGLLTVDEQRDPEVWKDPQALVNECVGRLAKREFPVEQFVAFLAMEFEYGIRVGMELGLELAAEKAQKK